MADYPNVAGRPPPGRYSATQVRGGERVGCVGCLGMLAAPVRRPARFLFASRDVFEVEDPKLRRLGLARSALGLVVTAVVGHAFHVSGLHIAGRQLLSSVAAVYRLGAFALIVGVIVLVCCQRAARNPHLLTPVYTYGLALMLIVLMIGSLILIFFLAHIVPLLAALAILCLLWWFAFFPTCCFYLVRDTFRAADANPLLAPVLSTVIPLLTFLQQLTNGHSGKANGGGIPGPVGVLMSVAGIVSTGALAFIEIRRLRGDHGITPAKVPPAAGKQRPSTPTETHPRDTSWPANPAADPWRRPGLPAQPRRPPPPGPRQAPPQGPPPP